MPPRHILGWQYLLGTLYDRTHRISRFSRREHFFRTAIAFNMDMCFNVFVLCTSAEGKALTVIIKTII
ncbi:hypothetical protein THIOM_003117 [Candidatus Thiomargarita nelsonii]|uniref:Uncharacterized protein n=1 Tax=Candidatus Thiomargarita nelsonii TaxID=1003181 RepID=A0A176RZH3_9GAMM|nr:hypothetical protein THIOM_003117 [Candidatus Thiomargarita nelsonii]